MIRHRVRLALVAFAAACACASCLDERVRVPVRVAWVDDSYNIKQIALFGLVVRRSAEPARDDDHHGELHAKLDASSCRAQDADETKDASVVESRTTGLDGTATLELPPGDYVVCSRAPTKLGGAEWAVPLRVVNGAWQAARWEWRDGAWVWVYPEETPGNEPAAQLVLSNDNAQKPAQSANAGEKK